VKLRDSAVDAPAVERFKDRAINFIKGIATQHKLLTDSSLSAAFKMESCNLSPSAGSKSTLENVGFLSSIL
jgi:hypothetical protein